jgi:hypothetical protein
MSSSPRLAGPAAIVNKSPIQSFVVVVIRPNPRFDARNGERCGHVRDWIRKRGRELFATPIYELDTTLDTALHSLCPLLCSHFCLEVGVSVVLLKNLPGN